MDFSGCLPCQMGGFEVESEFSFCLIIAEGMVRESLVWGLHFLPALYIGHGQFIKRK